MIDFLVAIALGTPYVLGPDSHVSHFSTMNSSSRLSQKSQDLPVSLKVTLLEAYETKVPPPGARGVHPVGHTVVRLWMENLSQNPVQFAVKSIKITPIHAPQALMQQTGESVELGGLQIKESGFHLTNQQGFSGYPEIQAVVTYRYQGKTFTAKSSTLKIAVSPQ